MLGMQSMVTAPRNVAVRKNRQTEEVGEATDMRNKAELSYKRIMVGSVLSGRGPPGALHPGKDAHAAR